MSHAELVSASIIKATCLLGEWDAELVSA